MLLALSAQAQYTYVSTPATDCTFCDAQLDFEFENSVDFELSFYYNGNVVPDLVIIDSGTSLNVPDLCPGNYTLEISIDGQLSTLPISVPSTDESAGSGGLVSICSTELSVDLETYLDGSQTGGTWIAPDGQAFSGNFEPAISQEGIYTYQSDGFCGLYAELWVEVNDPADPGNATTYLICENYPAFYMYDVLFGSPESGGNWYSAGNIPNDGYYEPASEDGGIFVYEIDSVEGCPAVYNTLFIIENQIADPGMDATLSVCPDATPFDMTGFLGGTPDSGGQWENESNQDVDAIFDPAVDAQGTYEYTIIGATPCPTVMSTLTITFNDGIDAGENGSLEACENDGLLNLFAALGGDPDTGGTWTDPNGQLVDEVIDASQAISGTYSYLIQATGCPDELSEVAVSIDQQVSAGPSGVISECNSVPFFDLDLLLGDGVTVGGVWLDEADNITDPMVALSDGDSYLFSYFIEGGACPDSESTHELDILETPYAGEDVIATFCLTEGVIDLNNEVDLDPDLPSYWINEDEEEISNMFELEQGSMLVQYVVESINICLNDTALLTLNVEAPYAEDQSTSLIVCSNDPLVVLNDEIPADYLEGGSWEYLGVILDPAVVDPDEFNQGSYFYFSPQTGVCPSPVLELDLQINMMPDAGSGGGIERCLNELSLSLNSLPDVDADEGGYWTYNGDLLSGDGFIPVESGILIYNVDGLAPCPVSQAVWNVDVLPLPEFNAGADVLTCSDVEAVEIGDTPNVGYTYTWTPSEGLSDSNSSNPEILVENVDELTNMEYVVEVSDGNCISLDTLSVEIYPLPALNEPNEVELCEGEIFVVNVPDNWSYEVAPELWVSEEGEGYISLSPLESGELQIDLLNEYGCAGVHLIEVELYPLPVLDFSVNPEEGCPPLEVSLINESPDQEGVTYIWSVEDQVLLQDTILILTVEGQYDVSLSGISEFGCESAMTMPESIEVFPEPIALFEFTPDDPNAYTEELNVLNTSPGIASANWSLNGQYVSSLWQPDFGIPIIEDLRQEVCLELVNSYGCVDSICQPITVQGDYTFYVPNAFTPNSDGRNEIFTPVIRGADVDHYTFRIWNRWGEMIFETNDLDEGWIGNVNGGDYYVPSGVYVWQVLLRNKYTGNDIEETGSVTVIR